jgi:pimeloyl-ACP methyl ester carboxylesterase
MPETIAEAAVDDTNPGLKRRTAVLVVHGMGSQRPLDTVRGIINAVWLDKDGTPGKGDKRYWLHPERKNDDIDLAVLTTSDVPDTANHRCVDFHELYWAHLMSETRAVAVLLWLFELVRNGPRLKPEIRGLWWGTTIFLCLLVQSIVLLLLHGILQFLGSPPLIGDNGILFGTNQIVVGIDHTLFGAVSDSTNVNLRNHPYHEPEALLLAPIFVLFMVAYYSAFFSTIRDALKIAIVAIIIALVAGGIFFFGISDSQPADPILAEIAKLFHPPALAKFVTLFLPIFVSLCVVAIAMGAWGAIAMVATYLSSSIFFVLYLNARYLIDWDRFNPLGDAFLHRNSGWSPFSKIWDNGWIFWSLNERYSAVIAFAIILIYLALYALFLQPYLGDAARYFRASPGNVLVRRKIRKEAVDTLDTLHKWGNYDRIIIVAHSLGTVVAYDMLRAYFSRINGLLPDGALLEPQFSQIDKYDPDKPSGEIKNRSDFRSAGREIIRKIAAQTINSPVPSNRKLPSWLVTDFVTLGSPLTHAHYLMCDYPTEDKLFYHATEDKLVEDFNRRVAQREFPTCPPHADDDGGLLAFRNPNTGKKEFHHAALFGLTRWTNLYFEMNQMFWGDAIGGPLKIFGPYIKDVKVSTLPSGGPAFFTHTSYWKITGPMGRGSPQIGKLRAAVNLVDGAV